MGAATPAGRRPPRPPRRAADEGGRERRRPRGGGGGGDLLARVLVAIPLIVLAIVVVDAGGTLFAVGVAVLAVLCLHELYGMYGRVRPVRIAGFLAAVGLVAAARFGDQATMLLVAVAAVPCCFLLVLPRERLAGGTASIAITLLGVWWIGLAFGYAMLLREQPHGDGVVIDVLVGAFIGDTAAYLGGRWFGRRPMAPRVSPNKTVEGLFIGVAAAVAAVWFAGLYQNWLSGLDALLLGLAVAVAAPLGDLFESFVKRDAGAKDAGRVFGAHGGALDRLDAAMFAIVAGYLVWSALV